MTLVATHAIAAMKGSRLFMPRYCGGSSGVYNLTLSPSKIRLFRLRNRNEVGVEVIDTILGADRFPPNIGIPAPALGHVHGFVERVLVLDLDEAFQEFVVRRDL